jgi:hypothetical protein
MRAMKHSHFFEQNNGYPTPFALADLGAQLTEQRLDIAPLDVAAGGASKDQLERALVLSLHLAMVP